MEIINIVLLSIGGTTTLLLIAGFLSKKILAHFLAKDIENYKASISKANSESIEKLKSELLLKNTQKERYLLKLEELHLLLMEMHLRICLKYQDVHDMVSSGATTEDVNRYIGSQDLGYQAFIIQSRIKSLSTIYASNIKVDTQDRIIELFNAYDNLGVQHAKGCVVITELATLQAAIEAYRLSGIEYMKKISAEITKT